MHALYSRISPLALSLTILGTSGFASAATITVTTTADTVADDGQCSLREAVTAANQDTAFGGCAAGSPAPTVDTILLPPGIYDLTRPGAGEDANQSGDLDVHGPLHVRGQVAAAFAPGTLELPFVAAASPVPVIRNRLGDPAILGDGDRVFHVDAGQGETTSSSLTLESVAIVDGDVGCTGPLCQTGGGGVDVAGSGELTLRQVVLANNRISCSGEHCGRDANDRWPTMDSAAALSTHRGGAVTIEDSLIADNHARCDDPGCAVGGVVKVRDANNPSPGDFTMRDSAMVGNSATCQGGPQKAYCKSDELLQTNGGHQVLDGVLIRDNHVGCIGETCDSDELLEVSDHDAPTVTFADVELTNNTMRCEGFDCDTDELIDGSGDIMRFSDLYVAYNELSCEGDECDTDEILDESDTVEFVNIQFYGNRQTCSGARCDVDEVIDLAFHRSETSDYRNISFYYNEGTCFGEECDTDDIADLRGEGSVHGMQFYGNSSTCAGDRCRADAIMTTRGNQQTYTDLEMYFNRSLCQGHGCSITPWCEDPNGCGVGMGGALLNTGDDTVIEDATIAYNQSSAGAGAIANEGQLTLRRAQILGNSAGSHGGAIINASGNDVIGLRPGVMSIEDSTVASNIAQGSGGGIYNPAGASLSVTGSQIQYNISYAGAGGIHNEGEITSLTGTSLFANIVGDCVNVSGGTGCP